MTLPEQAPEVAASTAVPARQDANETRKGAAAALVAYAAWGFLPILVNMIDQAGTVLIVAERTFWSFVLLAGILAFTGGFAEVRALLTDWRRFRVLALSTVLLVVNWLLYVLAVETGQVLEASFGYFI